MNRRSNIFSWVFFLSLFMLSMCLSFSNHKKEQQFTWEGIIWADKAGYYIYLPATFLYQFDCEKAPPGMDEKTGHGFILNKEYNKIYTKYTYGVALLLSPFFITIHGISLLFDIPELGGFSLLYQKMVLVGAVFYLIMGLWFLKQILSRYFNPYVQYFVLILVYFGTNLLYYTVVHSLMSHVYSFFLFSLYLFALLKFLETKKFSYFLLTAFAVSLAIVVRPINVLLLILMIFWDVTSWKGFMHRIMLWLRPGYLITFILIFAVCVLPQLLYWHYLTGNFIFYSYGTEGFANILDPKIVEVWFAPLNGLFLYTPMMLFMVAGMIFMIVRRDANGLLLFFFFLVVSYLCAAWQTWYFGCSFGQRSFIEYYTLFSIALAFLIQKVMQQRYWSLKIIVTLILLSFVYYNIRMTVFWGGCFAGSTWDWDKYTRLASIASRIPGGLEATLYIQDFENHDFAPDDQRAAEFSHSGSFSGTFLPWNPICGKIGFYQYEVGTMMPDSLRISFWAYKPRLISTHTDLECFVIHENDTLFQEKIPVDSKITGIHKWSEVKFLIALPELNQWDAIILIQFRNKSGKPLFLDDIRVEIVR